MMRSSASCAAAPAKKAAAESVPSVVMAKTAVAAWLPVFQSSVYRKPEAWE